ncbi:thioesterase domain-containing protein [Dactylosporangium sp. NPDC050688]|uniref:thioesterase domain-containing protein n=1 Tax=Dactylosporangium sp. NPDC050688 TaxID=3157217 RepID=UPI0033CF034A
MERQLRNIWSDIVGVAEVGVHDNFFDVGGTSVMALQVLSRIKSEFGYDIPLAAVLQAPTIAGLAMLMRGSATTEPTPLVTIRHGGDEPPIFCFHPLGGSVARYFSLARLLGDRQPVYGLQALGLFDGALAQRSIPQMARTYAEQILRVQPRPPYRLVGYSLGGTIAFETARLLAQRGAAPPLVVLIDTEFTYPPFDTAQLPYTALADFALKVDVPDGAFDGLDREQTLRAIFDVAVRQEVIGPDFPIARLESIYETVAGTLTAVAEYQPGPYSGPVVLIRSARETPTDEGAPADLGWSTVAPAVRTHFVGLGHFVIMEAKGAARIATMLRPYLDGVPAA